MKLNYQEKIKRLDVAASLFEYAQLMEEMSKQPNRLIKNIFREKEKQYIEDRYSEEYFKKLKKHHYYNGVITAFSYIEEEYLDKLKLKNINIDEKELESIFLNPSDIDKFRNHNPGQNNKLQVSKILKTIRNSLNHTENGALYKYIEDEDAIEIDLKDIGKAYDGSSTPFHVKIKLKFLMNLIFQIEKNGIIKSNFLYNYGGVTSDTPNLFEEIKKKTKVIRIISLKEHNYDYILNDIVSRYGNDAVNKLNEYIALGKIKAREYNYQNGGLSDIYINSIYEGLKDIDDDWRINYVFENIREINELKSKQTISNVEKKVIARFLNTRNILPFGAVTFDRYLSSLLFERDAMKTWNYSYNRVLKNELDSIWDLKAMNAYQWFLIDPIEKIYTEYENFIRYSIINYAPLSKEDSNEAIFVEYSGKKYNCTFIRNAFAHGRVGLVKNNGEYMFALYDSKNGLGNETNYYYEDEDFKPQIFSATELVRFAESLCISEKRKLDIEKKEIYRKISEQKSATKLYPNLNRKSK